MQTVSPRCPSANTNTQTSTDILDHPVRTVHDCSDATEYQSEQLPQGIVMEVEVGAGRCAAVTAGGFGVGAAEAHRYDSASSRSSSYEVVA